MRKNFTSTEKDILELGEEIEWWNGNTWHTATVDGQVDRDYLGYARVRLVNQARTRTIFRGQVVYGYPGNVRAATK